MRASANERQPCEVCSKNFQFRDLVPGGTVRDVVSGVICKDFLGWSPEKFICRPDLNRFRSRYVHSLRESGKGQPTALEHEVLRSHLEHEVLAKDTESAFQGKCTLGERLADRIATFSGSSNLLVCCGAFLARSRGSHQSPPRRPGPPWRSPKKGRWSIPRVWLRSSPSASIFCFNNSDSAVAVNSRSMVDSARQSPEWAGAAPWRLMDRVSMNRDSFRCQGSGVGEAACDRIARRMAANTASAGSVFVR